MERLLIKQVRKILNEERAKISEALIEFAKLDMKLKQREKELTSTVKPKKDPP